MQTDDYAPYLGELAQADALRTRKVVQSPQGARMVVNGRETIAFCNNDYLGLAAHPRLIAAASQAFEQYGFGGGASHFVSGHSAPHYALEAQLASFMGMESALFFSSGYLANIGILSALADRHTTIFADKLNHACLIDGAILSRAKTVRYAHCDMDALRTALENSDANSPRIIATDAVFSMDGDIAPLNLILDLAEEFNALLVIDDAHGFGVLGKSGRGTLQYFTLPERLVKKRVVYMATLGKAAGGYGAFVAGAATVVEWILQSARSYIFTTATPPAIAAALSQSLHIIDEEPQRRAHLHMLIGLFQQSLALKNFKLLPSETAIQPIIIGSNYDVIAVADALMSRGFWVPAIRPPTVPEGTARLRVSLNAAHSVDDVMDLIMALVDIDAEWENEGAGQ